jgi:hypothetical protein
MAFEAGGWWQQSAANKKQRKALQHDDERILWGSIKVGVLNFWIALLPSRVILRHVLVEIYY